MERHGQPEYAGERQLVSVCCGDGFDEAVQCAGCGGWEAGSALHHGMCRRCARKTVERLRTVLREEFSTEEREVLNDAFDGVPLTVEKEYEASSGGRYDGI